MKKISLMSSMFLVVVLSSGCASYFIKGAFKSMDNNADGILSYTEFYTNLSSDPDFQREAKEKGLSVTEYSRQEFDKADDNKDGRLSLTEFDKCARK